MTKSYFIVHVEPRIQNALNIFSLVCAITTLIMVVGLGYFRPHISNRVSLRFQAIIALVDVIRHLDYSNKIHAEGPLCAFIGFFGFFISHLYLFANMIVGINIQLLYFHEISPQKEVEILLLVVITLVSIVIDVIPFAFNFYGKSNSRVCFIRPYSEKKTFFKVFLIYFVQLAVLIYCLIIFIAVSMFLKLKKSYIENKIPNKKIVLFGEVVSAREFIQKLYFRMSLYPISAFICFLPYIVGNMYWDINRKIPDWMYASLRFGLRLTGALNLIALILDPHFQLAFINILKNGLYYSRVDKKEQSLAIDLNTIKSLKLDDECLIEVPGQESIRFEEYIKYV